MSSSTTKLSLKLSPVTARTGLYTQRKGGMSTHRGSSAVARPVVQEGRRTVRLPMKEYAPIVTRSKSPRMMTSRSITVCSTRFEKYSRRSKMNDLVER